MTQGLVKNVEDNKDTAFDIMLKSVSKTSYKGQKDNNFTNIMSNLNAKTEKAQSDFVDKAVKSNTSSINKKALDANQKSNSSNKVNSKNINKDNSAKNTDNLNKTKLSKKAEENKPNTTKTQNKNKTIQNETSVKNSSKKEIKSTDEVKSNTDIKQEKSDDVSNMDIDSFVEPSPDFIDDNTEIQTNENTIDENQALDLIGAALDINLSAYQSKDEKVNTLVNEIISSEDNLKINTDIIETSALFDNLEQKDQEELGQLFEKISSIKTTDIENNDNNKLSFEDIKNNLKNSINETVDLISTVPDVKEEALDSTLLTDKNTETEDINLSQDTNKVISQQTVDFELNQVDKNIIDLTSEISSNTSNKENESIIKNENIQENITPDNQIKVTDNDNSNSNNDVKNLENTDTKVLSNENKNIIEDNSKFENKELIANNDNTVQIKSELIQDNTVDNSEDLKNDIKANSNVKAETLPKENETDKKADETTVDNTKEKIALNQTVKTETDNSTKNTEEITKEENVVLTRDVNKILNQETETDNSTVQQQQDSEITKEASSNSDNTSFENNSGFEYNYNDEQGFKQNYKKDDIELPKVKFSENIQTDKKTNDTQTDEKLQVKTTDKTQNTTKLEENLQKAVYTQKLLDKMVVSVDNGNTSSSALTVADEVAKIAIEENGSINSTNLTGNILYDSTGQGFSIKHLSAMKAPESIFSQIQSKLDSNSILNQIGEKLTDLKNSDSQKLTMVLRPNDLGRLSIELLTNKDGLTTSILAQNNDVRAYIEKNIVALRNQLVDAGINVNNIQIKTVGESGFTNYDGNGGQSEQDANQAFENQNNSEHNGKNPKNQRQANGEFLAGLANYDYSFTKDFSGILNKTMSYSV